MAKKSNPPQKFRLTASVVASHFKHRCDRLFRWNAVETTYRGKPGIGWNVPARIRSHSRPGIALLMQAGDEFELSHVQELVNEVGEAQMRHAGFSVERGRNVVTPLPLTAFIETLKQPQLPIYIAQAEVDLSRMPGLEEKFLQQFCLDPAVIKLGVARPDLLQILPPDEAGQPYRLRIWDFKASQAARHEHFIQVAFYSFLLEHALREAGLVNVIVDTEKGAIRTRQGLEEFQLEPYRLAVGDFLLNRVPALLETPAADTHYHVRERCALCEYLDTCQQEADAHFDLSRIAYITSESKRQLCRAGIKTHRELARAATDDGPLIEQVRAASHDLSVNLPRYLATAQALEDGLARPLEATTLLMPRYEHVRVILSAEQDAVTGTCFALGIKTFEGWDAKANRPVGSEHVFVAEEGREVEVLLHFLVVLNELLGRIDAENGAIGEEPIDGDAGVVAAEEALARAQTELGDFKTRYPRLSSTLPDYQELAARREGLKEAVKLADKNLKQARRQAEWTKKTRQKQLHFYVYDHLDLLVLKQLVERHLFDSEPPELLAEIKNLVRLFPPESVLPDADTFRSVPGTIVTQVLRTMVALPVPYQYGLRPVSEMYQPLDAAGQERGYVFRARYGFGWEHSNQVAFERIHDVWQGKDFLPDPRDPDRVMAPADILDTIKQTVRNKLRATDSVVRRLKQDLGEGLRLRKEPFRLYDAFDPLDFRMLEALRIFTMLEASLAELQVKHFHTLPVEDRTARFECISGLRYLEGADEADGSLWFTFDPAARDAKFDVGDFNLVVTPADEPDRLLGDIDGELFNTSRWRHAPYEVTLEAYELTDDPPRIRLRPKDPVKFRDRVDLTKPCVLDRLYVDYNSRKVFDVLQRLQEFPMQARHIHELTAAAAVFGWEPFVTDSHQVEQDLRECVAAAGKDAATLLNSGQWKAWLGVFREPLTLIWGPPGTGKTHTLAHILLGYAMVARRTGRPMRILVTAFTHHAINNVLKKVAELAERYGLPAKDLAVTKVQGWSAHAADAELPERVERINDADLASHLNHGCGCLVTGATVWGIYKAMDHGGGVVQPWFDVILVDEASQMKLPDALIAFSASKPEANIILAGDDQQLPPIIHGSYPEEHEYMLSSVFAFMRYRIEQRQPKEPDIESRLLFQLEENFRMNEPLTAYPRHVLYRGRFVSNQPQVRITTATALDPETRDPIEFMLHPDRPVILCWYTSPRSFTARNPIEAELVTQLIGRLSTVLVDEETGQCYTPEAFAARGIAVLSPHRAQNSTIRQVLTEYGFGNGQKPLPLVDTVDKLQGQERDVVLVSYGVADGEYAEAEADFLLSRNRFNVAATRARHKLIVLCADTVLDVVPTDQQVLLDSMMLKEFRTYCGDGHEQFIWPSQDFGEVVLNVQWKRFDP